MAPWKALCAGLFFLTASVCSAQSREPDDSWLMQNYRFAGPPAPAEVQQPGTVLEQLEEIQNTLLDILRKADSAWNFEAALAAAEQAAANAQLIGVISGQLAPPQPPPPRTPPPQQPPQPPPHDPQLDPAKYVIAFRDHTVEPASAMWTDQLMLHYITPKGAHAQVRRDLVDWKRTAELNRRTTQ
jgi:hypothetical protein